MSDNKQIGHFMIGAGAIIEHPTKNQILITKRKNTVHENNKWEFIYGRIDNAEGIIPGLKREVFEETGLANIKIKKAIRFWNFYITCNFNCKFCSGAGNVASSWIS